MVVLTAGTVNLEKPQIMTDRDGTDTDPGPPSTFTHFGGFALKEPESASSASACCSSTAALFSY